MRPLSVLVLAGSLVLGACASSQSGDTAGGAPSPRRSRSGGGVITPADLTAGHYPNAFSAVEHMHPNWLRPQGGQNTLVGTPPTVGVFWEGETTSNGVDFLRELHMLDFKTIRYLSPTESASRYGQNFSWGAIVVARP